MFRRSVDTKAANDLSVKLGRRRGAGIESPRRRGTLMRRVSAVFRSNGMDSTSTSSDDDSEATDTEIRRPSGLGPMQPMIQQVHNAEEQDIPRIVEEDVDDTSLFDDSESIVGQLQYAWKAPMASPRLQSGRQSGFPPAPPSPSPSRSDKPVPPLPCLFPNEAVLHVLMFLPRGLLPRCALVSRTFYEAANAILYGTLVDPPSAALRADRAELVQSLTLTTYTPFAYSHSAQMNYTLQLERVLPQMSCLTSLTLPYFDSDLLKHHSAFGLRRLVLMNETITIREEEEVLAWLDGQTNVVEVSWPCLRDGDVVKDMSSTGDQDLLVPPQSPQSLAYSTAPSSPLTPAHPPGITYPHSPVSLNSSLPSPSKVSYSSPTLLPSLKYLHAPPSLVGRLCQFPRPLEHLTLTLTQSIYDGFKPASLMRNLPHSLRSIHFVFAPMLDRRTREKVLRVAGAMCSISTLGIRETTSVPNPAPSLLLTASPRRDTDLDSLFPLPQPKSSGGQQKTTKMLKKEEEERTRALWHLAMSCGICFPHVEEVVILPGTESYADWLAASPVWGNVQRIVYGKEVGQVWCRPVVVDSAGSEYTQSEDDEDSFSDYGTEIQHSAGVKGLEAESIRSQSSHVDLALGNGQQMSFGLL